MTGTFRLGRIFGVEVSLHWSWAFIFVLITWTFADGVLKDRFPEWSAAEQWVAGSVVALIFFASILTHELSHSVVARRLGIPVRGITLFVFGGVSNLGAEPKRASEEFWMAIAGPLTSFGLAILFGVLYAVLHGISRGFASVAANLAVINAALGLFNLVPGFPLDGGRVLRSIFWARERSIVDATRIASRIGEYIAYTMMGAGFLLFLSVDVIGGIWLFLIGNFLRAASSASYEQVLIERILQGVPAATIARQDYTPVSPERTLQELVDLHFLAGHGRCLAVVAGEELLGLVTLSDVRKVPREDWTATTALRAMTPLADLKTVGPKDDLVKVVMLMASGNLNQIPVVEGRTMRGLIERSDIIAYIQTRQAIRQFEPRAKAA